MRSWAAFALLAMALRALLPFGFMISPDAGGRFVTVALCSGDASSQTLLDLATGDFNGARHDDDAPDRNHAGEPCAFSAMAPLAPPDDDVFVLAPPMEHVVECVAQFRHARGGGLAAPPPWATGPPATH